MKNLFPYQESFEADKNLIELITSNSTEEINLGIIITSDYFIESAEKKNKLKEEYDALCVEMECASIAHTSHLNNVSFAVIRVISDLADDSADKGYIKFEQKASDKAGSIILNILEKI